MFLKEIKSLLESKISPKIYNINSEIYGLHYIHPSQNEIVKKIMLTISLTIESLFYAIKNRVNLIISINGLINKPITMFNSELTTKLKLLSKHPLNIFVLSNSFIAAQGGVSDTIMEILHLKLDKPFMMTNKNKEKIPIGWFCFPDIYPKTKKTIILEDLIIRVKNNMEMNKVSYVGNLSKKVRKICVIAIKNLEIGILKELVKLNCECVLIGNIHDEIAGIAEELGLCLIEISLFKSKIIALKKLYNILSLEYPYEEFFFFDSKNPLKGYS